MTDTFPGPAPEQFGTSPPDSVVPLAPSALSGWTVSGYHVVAGFTHHAGAEQYGHTYLLDVVAAAAAEPVVWEGLAAAALAGLCFRCSSVADAESLIRLHVVESVIDNAGSFAWTHAPVIDESCPLCDQQARGAALET